MAEGGERPFELPSGDRDLLLQDDDMPDDDYVERVDIPLEEDERLFSFKKLWAFTGPGFLMSIAYLDPGNIESDLQAGTIARYKLLWVLLWAHVVGLLLQRLSARLGVVSGKDMAQIAYSYYPKVPRLILWIMMELAIITSDMQEVIGTAIAIFLLSKGSIPLTVGVLVTILDTLSFLFIDKYGVRKLEFFFAILIATMAVSFGFEYFTVAPKVTEVLKGIFVPWCEGCGKAEFLQGMSLVGAIIQPHNFYLHSALVKSRNVDRRERKRVSEANFYYFLECGIALTCSFFINLFVISVFGQGLYHKTNQQVRDSCDQRHGIPDPYAFPKNNETVEADIYKAGMFLGCEFGMVALFIWAIGILAAGQSSTMTGTYAGQFVMEGFIQLRWPRWKRVLVTRSIAILPTLVVTFYAQGVQHLTGLNDLLNCIQMVQLPFALLPIITFVSSEKIMHDFRSSWALQTFALLAAALVMTTNVYFIQEYVTDKLGTEWYVFVGMAIPTVAYILYVIYLAIYCLVACGLISEDRRIIGFDFKMNFENNAPWLNIPGHNNEYADAANAVVY